MNKNILSCLLVLSFAAICVNGASVSKMEAEPESRFFFFNLRNVLTYNRCNATCKAAAYAATTTCQVLPWYTVTCNNAYVQTLTILG